MSESAWSTRSYVRSFRHAGACNSGHAGSRLSREPSQACSFHIEDAKKMIGATSSRRPPHLLPPAAAAPRAPRGTPHCSFRARIPARAAAPACSPCRRTPRGPAAARPAARYGRDGGGESRVGRRLAAAPPAAARCSLRLPQCSTTRAPSPSRRPPHLRWSPAVATAFTVTVTLYNLITN